MDFFQDILECDIITQPLCVWKSNILHIPPYQYPWCWWPDTSGLCSISYPGLCLSSPEGSSSSQEVLLGDTTHGDQRWTQRQGGAGDKCTPELRGGALCLW